MPHPASKWTVEMVQALPDDRKRYEVVDGELLVTPSVFWQHQDAIGGLLFLFSPYLSEHGIGRVLPAPSDIEFDEWTLVKPDLFVVPHVAGRPPRSWEEVRRLLLALEVLAPNTERADREVKRRLYQRQNVPEYWIVDVEARAIERWRPGDEQPEVLRETIEWRPDPAYSPLVIDLRKYFSEVAGD